MGRNNKFKDWVNLVGIDTVMIACGVSRRTVFNWLAGSTRPNRERCKIILAAAKTLTMEDVTGGR